MDPVDLAAWTVVANVILRHKLDGFPRWVELQRRYGVAPDQLAQIDRELRFFDCVNERPQTLSAEQIAARIEQWLLDNEEEFARSVSIRTQMQFWPR